MSSETIAQVGFEIDCEQCGETFDADQGWLDLLSDDERALCGNCDL